MTRRAAPGEAQAWVDAAITSETDDCLLWPFISQSGGYASVRHQSRAQLAHRVVLTAVAGGKCIRLAHERGDLPVA